MRPWSRGWFAKYFIWGKAPPKNGVWVGVKPPKLYSDNRIQTPLGDLMTNIKCKEQRSKASIFGESWCKFVNISTLGWMLFPAPKAVIGGGEEQRTGPEKVVNIDIDRQYQYWSIDWRIHWFLLVGNLSLDPKCMRSVSVCSRHQSVCVSLNASSMPLVCGIFLWPNYIQAAPNLVRFPNCQ